MTRRLYFLFPEVEQTRRVVGDLIAIGLSQKHIHVMARDGIALGNLPQATIRQKNDTLYRMERLLWNGNLALFFLAAVAAVFIVIWGKAVWVLIPVAIMAASFISGKRFITIPDVHLSDFQPALVHGEILLMLDIPKTRVYEIESVVRRHHPEAVPGGVGWTVQVLGI